MIEDIIVDVRKEGYRLDKNRQENQVSQYKWNIKPFVNCLLTCYFIIILNCRNDLF